MSFYDIFDEYIQSENNIEIPSIIENTGIDCKKVKNMVLKRISNEKPNKKKKTFTAILIAAVLFVCSAIGVYAGVKGYYLNSKSDGKYAQDVSLVKDDNGATVFNLNKKENITKPKFMKVKFNYVTNGFVKDEETSYKGCYHKKDNPNLGGISMLLYDVSDFSEIKDYRRNVIDSSFENLNGHDALFIQEKLYKSYDEDNPGFNKSVYMYFEDYDYLLYVFGGTDISKKELLKMLNSAELVECKQENSLVISEWIDNYSEEIYQDKTQWNSDLKIVASPKYNDFYSVGETISDDRLYADDEELKVKITVDDLSVSDNFDILGDKQLKSIILGDEINKSDYLDSNGKLKPVKVKYYGNGDGVNKLDELVATKEFNVKFLYETVTFKNDSDKDIKDYCVYHEIYTSKFGSQEDCFYDAVKNFKEIDVDDKYIFGEWIYDDFSTQGINNPNYISIPANSEVTVHMGYFILEDVVNSGINLSVYNGGGYYKLTPDLKEEKIQNLKNYIFVSKVFDN